jgi:hypothetical protein
MLADVHRDILNEVERDILVLGEKLQKLQAVAEYHASKLGVQVQIPTPLAGGAAAQNGSHADSNGHSATRFKNANQREAAAIVLREAGQPMRAGDIARQLVKYGYPKPAKMGKLTNALFTTMTRDSKRFKKVGVGLWGLASSTDTQETEEDPGE